LKYIGTKNILRYQNKPDLEGFGTSSSTNVVSRENYLKFQYPMLRNDYGYPGNSVVYRVLDYNEILRPIFAHSQTLN